MNKIITIVLISILLTGCSIFGTKIKVEATVTAVERAELILPKIDRITLDKIIWQEALTEETFLKVLKEIEKQGFDPVLIGITDEDYETMAINQAKTLKLLLQQRAVIEALKDYYIKKNEE